MRARTWLAALVFSIALAGCKQKKEASNDPRPTVARAEAPPPLVGMADPFAAPKGDASKLLETGFAALKDGKPQVVVAAMQNVVADAPDYTVARFALVRALVALGRFDDAETQWKELLLRDFVGYAGKLAAAKEFAALRASPAWQRFTADEDRARAPYAAGLAKGFFFVARTRSASEPEFAAGATDAALSLRQEVFHYDPDGKRFRRLTASDGHVFAIDRSPDGKSLFYLVATKLHRENNADSFVDPKVGVLDLATLAGVGPFAQKGRFDSVGLGTNRNGQALFTFVASGGASAAYTVDTARTTLAALIGDGVIPRGGETRAWPNQVAHFDDKAVPGVKMEDGATQFRIDGVTEPVIASRPLAQSSLAWSPAKARLTYAGKLDACKLLKDAAAKDKNELYVYDVNKHSAQRVAAAVSFFESVWLDEDRLVYEGGVGKEGKLHLYSFAAHADVTLPTRHGAGLYGVPTLACEQAETGIDEEIVPEETEND